MASRPGALSGCSFAAPGKRTVSAALRVMGHGQTEQFRRYHRVLNRAVWSGSEASHVLLGVLVRPLVPNGPLVIGVDETLERGWGKKIAAKRDLPHTLGSGARSARCIRHPGFAVHRSWCRP